MDDDEEDGGGGNDEQQPHLVPFLVLRGDHSGADGDKEAGGKGDLQCEPVGGASLLYKVGRVRIILDLRKGRGREGQST